MENLTFVSTLSISLAAALLFGFLARKIRLSPIIGYLFAGILVSPHTPGFVASQEIAGPLSDIGIILLMFGVGLNFHLQELLSVWKIALSGAVLQSLAATAITAIVTHALGWSWSAGILLGLAISVASTVVLVRVLTDFNKLNMPAGRVAIGWLVVEDIFTVLVLIFLPLFFGNRASAADVLPQVGFSLVKIGLVVATVFLVGGKLLPWLLENIVRTRSRELFTLTVLVIALGIAAASAHLLGTSIALGAFLAGMVVGRSEFGLRAATDALPMRDAFAVLFFVSIGMLFNPVQFVSQPVMVAILLLIIIIAKPLAAFTLVLAFRYPVNLALVCALSLAQIGEFSFIMATVGHELHVLPDNAINLIIASSILSISANPLLFRLVGPLDRLLSRSSLISNWVSGRARVPGAENGLSDFRKPGKNNVIIVGYGIIGKTLTRLLRENDIEVTIVEMNIDTVRALKAEGINAIYGDAQHHTVLKEAGVLRARGVILSAMIANGSEIIRLAKSMNRKLRIIARSTFIMEKESLLQAGADVVFTGEEEIALAMIEFVLRDYGAPVDRIEVERLRFRSDQAGSEGEEP